MTDRKRLKKIENMMAIYPISLVDDIWLVKTLRGYIDRNETTRKIYDLFIRTIRAYDKLMLERRKELDIYNKEHPKE